MAGEVKEALVPRRQFLNAALDKAARENERNALWLRTDDGRGRGGGAGRGV